MVARYMNKQEKFQTAKRWATVEKRPVREVERAMDLELFWESWERWEEDSPYCAVLMHKMF